MKRKFLRFENIDLHLPPGHRNKFMRHARFNGGSGGAAPTPTAEEEPPAGATAEEIVAFKQRKELLKKVKETVTQTITELNLQNADGVNAAFATMMGDATPAALQAFMATEKPAMETTIRKMAGALQRLTASGFNGSAGAPGSKPLNIIKQMLSDKKVLADIQHAMSRQGMGAQVVLSTHGAMEFAKQAAAPMDTTNTIDDTAVPDDILNSFSVDGFVKKRRPKEYIYDIASRRTVAEIKEYKTWMEEGDEEGAFALVLQGAVKPLVSKSLIRNVSKYKKVAGKRVYTEEFAKFRKEAYGILEELFNDQLLRNYAAILTTSLIASAAAYVGTALDGVYENPTDYHAIGAVAAQIETLEFDPDLLIIHPQDKWRIGLQQDQTGQFFITIPQMSPSGVVTMMGFRVFTTSRIDIGEFILGEAGLYKIEDEPVTVRMGYGITVTKDGANVTDVKSDFDSNQFRIIAETFFHAYIATSNLGSFVKANFEDMKALLLKPAV